MHNLIDLNQELIILIKFILAHLLSDFVFQTSRMVSNKNWFSKQMMYHILIVFGTTALLTFSFWQALMIAALHYLIDGTKISLGKKIKKEQEVILFIGDQSAHVGSLLLVWSLFYGVGNELFVVVNKSFLDLNYLIIASGYLFVTTPLGYLIGKVTSTINNPKNTEKNLPGNEDRNGFRIGVFERIIILTFVLLGKSEAIGFLITGKSLLRFGSNNEHKKSEYVLLGTLMSYALTIVVGVIVKSLIG